MALSGRAETTRFHEVFVQLTWTATQSIVNNTTRIQWSLDGRNRSGIDHPHIVPYEMAGNFFLSIDGQVAYDKPEDYRIKLTEGVHIASGVIVVPHNMNGSKTCEVKMEAGIYNFKPNCFYNGIITLDTIPRASQPSCITRPRTTENIGDIGNKIIIHMNRKSPSFTHTVTYWFGENKGTIATDVGDNVAWTIPLDFAKQIPNATIGKGTIFVYTYSGNTQVGLKSVDFLCTVPSSMTPTVNSASVVIDNSAHSVVEEWGLYVSGYSKANIKATASGSYGSTIKNFTISGGYNTTVTDVSLNYTGGKFTSSGSKTFNVVAKDSRGRSSAQTTAGTITVYAYNNPLIALFSVERSSTSSTTMIVKSSWSFASVNGKNSASAVLLYKKATSSGWTTYGVIENNQSITLDGTFDEASSYNFKIIVTDALSNKAQAETFVSTLAVLLDFRAGGKGLGIGKIAETDSMEVALDAKFMGNIYIYDSSGNSMTLDEYIKHVVSA